MIGRTLFIALALVCASAASAQTPNRFDGRLVHSATGAPAAGATVSIAGLPGSLRTDRDGRFSWVPAPRPPFQVVIILAGGQVVRPALIRDLAGAATIEIGAFVDEAVTVLGAAPSISTTPASASTILSATQVARRNPENLTQALETVPGVSQVSEGHAAVPAIRGLARGRTLLLIDGGRVTAERRVGPGSSFLNPAVIEGIDVARGPGSVAYGSDAFGGIISVRTRRAVPGSPFHARVTATGGAGIPEARGSVELSQGWNQGGVLFQAHVRRADDYGSPAGDVFNSGWEDQGFLLNLTQTVGKGLLATAWQSDFGRDFERPRNNSRTVRFVYPFENSHRFTASYELPGVAGFQSMTFTGFLGGHEQRTDQDRFATATTGRSIERADVSAKDFYVKATGDRVVGSARLEIGVDVNGRYGLKALDIIQAFDLSGGITRDTTNVPVDDARRIDSGVYVQAETAAGSYVRLAGGMRADYVTTRNTAGFFGDRATSNQAVSGFGAATVMPFTGLRVTAQVARGFRDPVLSDRYFRGPSGRGFITGNPDLEPETSLQFDLAARYTMARAEVAVNVYQYRVNDLIERYQTQTDFFFVRNRGRARLRGIELEGRSDLGRGYSIEMAAHLARGLALDDRAGLDDISPATVSVLGRKDVAGRWHVQGRIARYAADPRPGPSEVAAPGATLVDAGAGWRIVKNLEVRGLMRNLLNETYYASPDMRFVLAPGRSASLTTVVEF